MYWNRKNVYLDTLNRKCSATFFVAGIQPDPDNVKAIVDLPPSENVTELNILLGIVNFVTKLVPNLSDMAYPLYQLLRSDIHWIWEIHQEICHFSEYSCYLSCSYAKWYNQRD